ncbi:MAG: Flp family type IVb pilin [Paracoccaceae bacterium]
MQNFIQRFWNDEMGSSVIDWCILAAGAASLGVAVVSTLV